MKKQLKELIAHIPARRVLLYALYIFLVMLAQDMIFPQVRILGACPMILPAAAVALGMFGGPAWGTVFALVLGIFADMAFPSYTILFTVTLAAIAFGTNFLTKFFLTTSLPAFGGAAAAAMLLTGLLQMLVVVLGGGFSSGMLRTVVLQTLWALPLSVLTYYPLAKWFHC